MGASFNYYTKKSHRYLGVFIGIQFVMWTVGGFYFSWTNIKEIRGDHLRSEAAERDFGEGLVSPSAAITEVKAAENDARVRRVNLAACLGILFTRSATNRRPANRGRYLPMHGRVD